MRFVLVTGHQRSGTSVFRNALAASPDVHDFGEVMTPGRAEAGDPVSVFNFAAGDESGPLERPFPAGERSWDMLRRYFERLATLTTARIGLVDTKIDFLHNFDPVSHLPTEEPLLLSFAMRRTMPIIHFHRVRQLDQLLSAEIGHRVGRWHYTTRDASDPEPPESFTVDVNETMARLGLMRGSSRLLAQWLTGYAGYVPIVYEDAYDEDRMTPEVLARVDDAVGPGIPHGLRLPFRRSPFDPTLVIANYRELETTARGLGLLEVRLAE